MRNAEFLEYLKSEFQEYCAIPISQSQHKSEKKQFINGLMKASRFFGVSFDDLNEIIKSQPQASFHGFEDMLDVPTYIRNEMSIKS
ncbi:hypothetical protein [Vibrio cortegadensis]|uniref:hypothetical protein n=1 Tax=Vibrio cortegadensis TaxID=1328770 RepID=UPI00352E0D04